MANTPLLRRKPKARILPVAACLLSLVCVVASFATLGNGNVAQRIWGPLLNSSELPLVLYDQNIQVAYANDAALRFYNIDLPSITGKEPQQLHAWAAPYMLNFKDWAAEQVARNTAARNGTLNGQSKVPMHMSKDHAFGEKYWYLSSRSFNYEGRRYLLTTFVPGPPPEN